MRSDELYTEIILVCDVCHDILFEIAKVIKQRKAFSKWYLGILLVMLFNWNNK